MKNCSSNSVYSESDRFRLNFCLTELFAASASANFIISSCRSDCVSSENLVKCNGTKHDQVFGTKRELTRWCDLPRLQKIHFSVLNHCSWTSRESRELPELSFDREDRAPSYQSTQKYELFFCSIWSPLLFSPLFYSLLEALQKCRIGHSESLNLGMQILRIWPDAHTERS